MQGILGSQQDLELDPRTLGRLRTSIRKELATLIGEIDALVESISTGQDIERQSKDWQRVIHGASVALTHQNPGEISAFLRAERDHWTERELLATRAPK